MSRATSSSPVNSTAIRTAPVPIWAAAETPLSGEALYKNQVQRLIDNHVVSGEKEEERRLQMCVVGVGEAVWDYTVLIH